METGSCSRMEGVGAVGALGRDEDVGGLFRFKSVCV